MRNYVTATARTLRRLAKLGEPPFSTRQILDSQFPNVLVTGRVLPEGVDELVTETNGEFVLYYRRGLSSPDQRFAIAHGLAHVLWDRGSPEHGAAPGRAGVACIETRADMFAAELLAPTEELAPYLGPHRGPSADLDHGSWLDMLDEIASHFQVPAQVIATQLSRQG